MTTKRQPKPKAKPEPKKLFTPRIEPVQGEQWVYIVESESAKVPEGKDWREYAHRVELVAEQIVLNGSVVFNGCCSCPDVNYHKHKNIRDGRLARCKHIEAAMRVAYDPLLVYWATQNKHVESKWYGSHQH